MSGRQNDVVDPRLIRIAAEVLAETDLNDPVDLPMKIQRAGVGDWNLTCLFYQMIPLAMGRAMLEMTGIYLHDEFILWDRVAGESSMRQFRDDPVYCQIQAELPNLFSDGDQRRLQNVLRRSAESHALQQLKEAHGDIRQVAVGAPIITLGLPRNGAAGFVFRKRFPADQPPATPVGDQPNTLNRHPHLHRRLHSLRRGTRRSLLVAILGAVGFFFACSGAAAVVWMQLFLRRSVRKRSGAAPVQSNRPPRGLPSQRRFFSEDD